MFDIRPPLHIVGLVLVVAGVAMLAPAAVDLADGNPNGNHFLKAALYAVFIGTLVAIATRVPRLRQGLSLRQVFLMTAAGWVLVPVFGAIPFMDGEPGLSFTDAYFEAVSGFTSTGATVIAGIEFLPPGAKLWRGMMNWMGGLGFSFLALVFLPFLRVGGMQFFESTGFNTMGKVLPRAHEIAGALLRFYLLLTAAAFIAYRFCGMEPLDAIVHAFTTVSCGGFSNYDESFARFPGAAEYFGTFFMIMGCLPFIRFIQLMGGAARPLWRDAQVRTFLALVAVAVGATVLYRLLTAGGAFEPVLRSSLFNIVSIFSGTGLASADVASWGGFAVAIAFVVGMIGGCASSTSASISIFRWQIAVLAIRQQMRKLHSPSRVVMLRYQGREVGPEVLNPVIAFFTAFVLAFGVMSALLAFSGVDMISAVFAVWTSLGNIGVGFGDIVTRTGTMADVPAFDKWVLSAGMLLGRVGMMPLLVVLLPRFWRG